MDASYGSHPRILSEIDPHCEWVHGTEFDTLVIDVTGFRKEELKVQVDAVECLKVTGQRGADGRRWCHFLKRFQLPDGCDAARIKVLLDKGVLYVQVPNPNAIAAPEGHAMAGASSEDDGDTAAETYHEALQEHAGNLWSSRHGRQGDERSIWQLAKMLSKHKQVILNVVLVVVLVWLVAFAKNKPGAGKARNE